MQKGFLWSGKIPQSVFYLDSSRYTFAILFTYCYTDFVTNNSDNSPDAETLRRYFGSVPLFLDLWGQGKTSLKMEGDVILTSFWREFCQNDLRMIDFFRWVGSYMDHMPSNNRFITGVPRSMLHLFAAISDGISWINMSSPLLEAGWFWLALILGCESWICERWWFYFGITGGRFPTFFNKDSVDCRAGKGETFFQDLILHAHRNLLRLILESSRMNCEPIKEIQAKNTVWLEVPEGLSAIMFCV